MCLVNVSIEKVATTSLNFYYKLIPISYNSPKLFVRKIQIVIEYSLSPQKTPELFCCSSLSTFLLRVCNFATCSWVIEFSDYVLSNWNFYSPTLQLTKDPHTLLYPVSNCVAIIATFAFSVLFLCLVLISVSVSVSLWFIKNSFNMRSLLTCCLLVPRAGMRRVATCRILCDFLLVGIFFQQFSVSVFFFAIFFVFVSFTVVNFWFCIFYGFCFSIICNLQLVESAVLLVLVLLLYLGLSNSHNSNNSIIVAYLV